MNKRNATVAAILLICTAGPVTAQTMSNPDISAIGDMRGELRTRASADARGLNTMTFDFHELELAVNAYLNPWMRADVFIGFHGTEGANIDVEEASATILRGLPWSFQAKAGQYLLDFGRINTEHAHQWAWLDTPLMHRTMLGAEGLRPMGLQLSTLQSIGDNAITLSFNAFDGSPLQGDQGDGQGPAAVGYSSRISWFRQFGDAWSAEAAVSGLYGVFDTGLDHSARLADLDMKVRWRPDAYRAIVWVFETMHSERDDTTATRVRAAGAFSSIDVRFRRRFDAGAFGDYSQDARVDGADTKAWGAFFGFMPSEETARFSVVYRNEKASWSHISDNSVTVQLVWSMGPHKPHTF